MLPSADLRLKFLKFATSKQIFGQNSLQEIFILPVFEVADGFQVPESKSQLQREFADGSIRQFHNETCFLCHFSQNSENWIRAEVSNEFEYKAVHWSDTWEPYFIQGFKITRTMVKCIGSAMIMKTQKP